MSKKYSQGYLKTWEKDPVLKDWIACDPKCPSRAYCRYCECSLVAHKKDLVAHGQTQKHQREIKNSLEVKTMKPLTPVIFKPREQKVVELRLSAFIAEHCSIKCIDHLSELVQTLDQSSTILSSIRLKRTKCTMLIKNAIGPSLLENLVEDVGDSNFSLIVDESTDVSNLKTLCLVIKYFSVRKKRIITTFYRIVELEDCTAKGIYESVTNQLAKDKLILKNLIGIGTDGANVMVGAHSSLSTLLKSEVPDLVVVKCVCHSLHLCAEAACKYLPRQLEFLIRESHNYFSLSPKRLFEYKKFCSKSIKKIPKLAGTRWLAREAAVDVVLNQWDDLLLFFKKASTEDKCYSAETLVNIMSVPAHKAFLIFLKITLGAICKTNRLFQSTNIDIFLLFQDVMMLYKSFLNRIVVPAQFEKIPDSQILSFKFDEHLVHIDSVYLGYEFDTQANTLSPHDKTNARKQCVDFLVAFCHQLQQRLPKNLNILQTISCFRPEICTSQKKPSIIPIVNEFRRFKTNECEQEWLDISLKKWGDIGSVEKFWATAFFDVDSAGNNRFKHISNLALSLLSLPISNAFVERAFSVYNSVKSKLRNRMSIDLIQNILMVRFHLRNEGLTCDTFIPNDQMVKLFNASMYDKATEIECSEILDEIELECFDIE